MDFLRCAECARSFHLRTDYNQHRKKHDRPYSCSMCKKSFGLKTDLERHRITHRESSFKFKCKYPGCTFKGTTRKDYLWRHMRTRHQAAKDSVDEKDLRAYYNESKLEELYFTQGDSGLQLLEAVSRGDDVSVQELLTTGADVWATDSESRSAFIIAIKKGSESIFNLLLTTAKQGASPEKVSDLMQLLLHKSASIGSEPWVRIMLANGASANALSKWSHCTSTALHTAAKNGHRAIAQILLDSGASLETKSEANQTALFAAIAEGQASVTELLLERGARSQLKSMRGVHAMFNAIIFKEYQIVELLLDNGVSANATVKEETALLKAIELMADDIVALLIAKGADVNKLSGSGFYRKSPLHRAAKCSERMTKLLIDAGASVELLVYGQTPLQCLIEKYLIRGSTNWPKLALETARLLIAAGARRDYLWRFLPNELSFDNFVMGQYAQLGSSSVSPFNLRIPEGKAHDGHTDTKR